MFRRGWFLEGKSVSLALGLGLVQGCQQTISRNKAQEEGERRWREGAASALVLANLFNHLDDLLGGGDSGNLGPQLMGNVADQQNVQMIVALVHF